MKVSTMERIDWIIERLEKEKAKITIDYPDNSDGEYARQLTYAFGYMQAIRDENIITFEEWASVLDRL